MSCSVEDWLFVFGNNNILCSDFSVRLIYKLRVLKVNYKLRETFIKNYKNIYIVLLFSYKKQ